jgi:YfiH family protein
MTEPQPNRAFEWVQAPWGLALRCVPLSVIAPHYFTVGNLQLRDDRLDWDAVARALEVSRDRLRLIRQVHGAAVAMVHRGADATWPMPEADAIVSDDPSSAIAVRVADCAPILLADTQRGVVGAAHAGWRGTMQSVAIEAVRAMQREFGSCPADLVSAIGPCLGACCGEVGEEVLDAFRRAGHDPLAISRWFSPGPRGRPHLDLWHANIDQLAGAGVLRSNIHVAELCTKTHAGLMHSYRVSGAAAGRMLGVIKARVGHVSQGDP